MFVAALFAEWWGRPYANDSENGIGELRPPNIIDAVGNWSFRLSTEQGGC